MTLESEFRLFIPSTDYRHRTVTYNQPLANRNAVELGVDIYERMRRSRTNFLEDLFANKQLTRTRLTIYFTTIVYSYERVNIKNSFEGKKNFHNFLKRDPK